MLTQPTGSSLAVLAEASQERVGDASSLLFEGTEQTSTELAAGGRRFATGLTSIGVGRGDRVVVCMANCPEVLQTYQAVWRIGAVVTPLLFLLSPDEMRHAIADSGAVAAVTTPEFAPAVSAAAAGLGVRIVVVGDAGEDAVSFADLASGAEAPLVDTDPGAMAGLLYTGGTTGRSKGVMLSHDALSVAAWAAVKSGEDSELDVSLLPLPLAHAYGLLVSTMAVHQTRPHRTVLMRWFDPAGWVALAEQERVEVGGLVPMMVRMILDQPLEDHDLSSLHRMVSGSAPLPAEIAEQWARRLPGCELVEGYGLSETAALASTTPTGAVRAGSVGRAAPLVELRIERPDGTVAETGEDGEVCIKTPSIMTGYWNAPEATAQAIRDGWFHTGDIGHVDDEGYLFIVDRLKDLIIRGGFNVYPRDVEEALMRHPDVAVCAVVGRPDEVRGEEVVAFVQLQAGATATEDDLVAYGREHLSRVKYPREVHIVPAVPVTSVGKLDRKALRAQI